MCDADDYFLRESFDVIIFNEVLYYSLNPLSLMKQYEDGLKADGIFIVSMLRCKESTFIWKKLEALFPVLDETMVTHGPKSWTCKVLIGHGSRNDV